MLPKDFYRFWFQHQKHYQSMLYYIKVFIFPLLNVCSGARGFPGSSAGKESTCNPGNLGLIPESGRSPREEMGYPLRYSWASLVTQMVKNPPVTWETWVLSLGWEDTLEESMSHSSLAWRISWAEYLGRLQSMVSQRVRRDWVTNHSTQHNGARLIICYNYLKSVGKQHVNQHGPCFKPFKAASIFVNTTKLDF